MRSLVRFSFAMMTALLLGVVVSSSQTASAQTAGSLLISEFRLSGPAGTNDEFIEIYNNTDADIVTAPPSGAAGTSGYGVYARSRTTTTVTLICNIPSTTTIRARSNFLCTSTPSTPGAAAPTNGYSLSAYGSVTGNQSASPTGGPSTGVPAGTSLTAATGVADVQYAADINEDSGLMLLNINAAITVSSSGVINAPGVTGVTVTVLDRVGFKAPARPGEATPNNATFFCETTCLNPIGTGTTIGQYSFLRRNNPTTNTPQDTDNSQADFILISTTPQNQIGVAETNIAGINSVLGAPGPENSADVRNTDPILVANALDTTVSQLTGPNAERDFTIPAAAGANDLPGRNENPAAPQGTFTLRFRYNNPSAETRTINRLRFRIVDISTNCGPATIPATGTASAQTNADTPTCQTEGRTAIIRVLQAPAQTIFVPGDDTSRNVLGTTLEQPPIQLGTGTGTGAIAATSPSGAGAGILGGGINSGLVLNNSNSDPGAGSLVLASTAPTFGTGGGQAGQIAPNTTIRVRFRFGVARGGSFRLVILREVGGTVSSGPPTF